MFDDSAVECRRINPVTLQDIPPEKEDLRMGVGD